MSTRGVALTTAADHQGVRRGFDEIGTLERSDDCREMRFEKR